MKKAYHLIVTVVLAAGLSPLTDSRAQSPSSPAAAPTRVATCDLQELYLNYNRAKDMLAQLNDKKQAGGAEVEKRGKATDALQMELDGLKQGSKEYDTRLAELQRQTIDRAVYKQYQEALLAREHRKLTTDIYQDISRAIAQVAREQGYNLVLYRERELDETDDAAQLFAQIRGRKVIYSDDGLDITKDVLTRLNDNYRGAKK